MGQYYEIIASFPGARSMQASDLVGDNLALVSLPEVCLRIQQLADDPRSTAEQIGAVLSQDPALTVRLLKLVNSAFYGLGTRIDTASRAVSVVGVRELRNLALAASAVEVFARIPTELVNMVNFWKHSVFCGLVARQLALRCGILHAERLFVAGLLHDVGRLLIYNRLPDASVIILEQLGQRPHQPCEVEWETLGFDHAQVCAELMRAWKLPLALRSAVEFHHHPTRGPSPQMDASLVHIANAITHWAEDVDVPSYDPYAALIEPEAVPRQAEITGIDPVAWANSGLTDAVLSSAVQEAAQGFDQILDVIYPVPIYR